MAARPELVDLLKRLDDWDYILDAFDRARGARSDLPDPEAIPTVDGLPITAEEACLLGHATLGEVHAAMRVASERRKWEVLAMGHAIAAHKAAIEILKPWWTGDMMLKDGMAAAPPDVRAKASGLFAEHDYWASAIDDKRWNMTEADLKEGWLRGEFRRLQFNEAGECVCWRQIRIIDPGVAAQRAEIADEYRRAVDALSEIVRRVAAENPTTTSDEVVATVDAAYADETRDLTARAMVLGVELDQIDERHGVPVDHAGMPSEESER